MPASTRDGGGVDRDSWSYRPWMFKAFTSARRNLIYFSLFIRVLPFAGDDSSNHKYFSTVGLL